MVFVLYLLQYSSMFNMGSKIKRECLLIVDIGSGSIGMALVHYKPEQSTPTIIWSHRESCLFKGKTDKSVLKHIQTTLINSFLEFGSVGLKKMHQYDSRQRVDSVKITISAPWSLTVTKSIKYENKEPFVVNEKLIKQLEAAAEKEVKSSASKSKIKDSNLTIINQKSISWRVNGYQTDIDNSPKGNRLELSYLTVLTEQSLIDTINESVEKILPKATIGFDSFMSIYYNTLRHMRPNTAEACLIDVTDEAVEMGIVRDNILTYTNHIPYGSRTLAREIENLAQIPQEEAYGLLKNEFAASTKTNDQIQATFSAFDLKLASLFKETGDSLSIAETLFLHTDRLTEEFYIEHLKNGAKEATRRDHIILLISEKIFPHLELSDSALLLSVYYYSRQLVKK